MGKYDLTAVELCLTVPAAIFDSRTRFHFLAAAFAMRHLAIILEAAATFWRRRCNCLCSTPDTVAAFSRARRMAATRRLARNPLATALAMQGTLASASTAFLSPRLMLSRHLQGGSVMISRDTSLPRVAAKHCLLSCLIQVLLVRGYLRIVRANSDRITAFSNLCI